MPMDPKWTNTRCPSETGVAEAGLPTVRWTSSVRGTSMSRCQRV